MTVDAELRAGFQATNDRLAALLSRIAILEAAPAEVQRQWGYAEQISVRYQSYPDGRHISNADSNYGAMDQIATENAGAASGSKLIEWENVGYLLSAGETLNQLLIAGRINDATNTPDCEIEIFFVTPDSLARFSAGWDNDNEVVATSLYKDMWRIPTTGALGQVPLGGAVNDFHTRLLPLNYTPTQTGWITIIATPTRLAASVGNDYFYTRNKYFLTAPPVV